MSIRFQCGSCSQPIEVDDEWASKPVACPYCRKTVTAPMESTLGDPSAFQTAVPVASASAAMQPFSDAPEMATRPVSRNRLAFVALGLAIGALGMLLACGVLTANHVDQFEQFNKSLTKAANYPDQIRIMNEMLEADPNAMGWMIPIAVLSVGWLGTNLAAIVCGIIAVRRQARRGIAIAALALGFLPMLLFF